jgi:hypothetical protein
MKQGLIASLVPLYEALQRLSAKRGGWYGEIDEIRGALAEREKSLLPSHLTAKLESLQRRGLLIYEVEHVQSNRTIWTVLLLDRDAVNEEGRGALRDGRLTTSARDLLAYPRTSFG